MSEITRLRYENSQLRRTKSQLAEDLDQEKGLVRHLVDTVKNYEKILRLDGSAELANKVESVGKHTKYDESLEILCRSIALLDQECAELSRTVGFMTEKVRKIEKLYEHRKRRITNLNMRIERLDAVAFGSKVEC